MLIQSDFKFTTSNMFHYRYPHFTRHCRWTDSNQMSNASSFWTLNLLHNKSNGSANLDQLPESGTLAWLSGVWGPQWSVWKCQDLQRVTWMWTHSGMAVGCLGSMVICMEVPGPAKSHVNINTENNILARLWGVWGPRWSVWKCTSPRRKDWPYEKTKLLLPSSCIFQS